MTSFFTKHGTDVLNDIFGRMWVTVCLVDVFGITGWESERRRNDDPNLQFEIPPAPPGEWTVVCRVWETATSDQLVAEQLMGFVLGEGDAGAVDKGAPLWFGPISPPPPPPEPSASDSD